MSPGRPEMDGRRHSLLPAKVRPGLPSNAHALHPQAAPAQMAGVTLRAALHRWRVFRSVLLRSAQMAGVPFRFAPLCIDGGCSAPFAPLHSAQMAGVPLRSVPLHSDGGCSIPLTDQDHVLHTLHQLRVRSHVLQAGLQPGGGGEMGGGGAGQVWF